MKVDDVKRYNQCSSYMSDFIMMNSNMYMLEYCTFGVKLEKIRGNIIATDIIAKQAHQKQIEDLGLEVWEHYKDY